MYVQSGTGASVNPPSRSARALFGYISIPGSRSWWSTMKRREQTPVNSRIHYTSSVAAISVPSNGHLCPGHRSTHHSGFLVQNTSFFTSKRRSHCIINAKKPRGTKQSDGRSSTLKSERARHQLAIVRKNTSPANPEFKKNVQ